MLFTRNNARYIKTPKNNAATESPHKIPNPTLI